MRWAVRLWRGAVGALVVPGLALVVVRLRAKRLSGGGG
jgi:hypothetical protein